jgi:hypothetical protein
MRSVADRGFQWSRAGARTIEFKDLLLELYQLHCDLNLYKLLVVSSVFIIEFLKRLTEALDF